MTAWLVFITCALLLIIMVGAVLDWIDDEEKGVKK